MWFLGAKSAVFYVGFCPQLSCLFVLFQLTILLLTHYGVVKHVLTICDAYIAFNDTSQQQITNLQIYIVI
jgi:hypothetical protein